MNRIVGIVAVLALLSACSPAPTTPPLSQPGAVTPSPPTSLGATPPASASPSSAPSASPVAAGPKVVCETPQNHSTLTCEAGVTAARAAVGPDPTVATIEFWFGWGPLCGPNQRCALLLSNTGHVFFRRTGGNDLVVAVTADKTGKVTASAPLPLSSPSPS